MIFKRADQSHLKGVLQWFPDETSCRMWAGPKFRYPYSDESLKEDLRLNENYSFVLLDDINVVGFGQLFEKFGRIHLARLATQPRRRGEGLGRKLIENLLRVGPECIRSEEYSLNVYSDNFVAISCYQSFGFVSIDSPERHGGFDDCLFMRLDKQAGMILGNEE